MDRYRELRELKTVEEARIARKWLRRKFYAACVLWIALVMGLVWVAHRADGWSTDTTTTTSSTTTSSTTTTTVVVAKHPPVTVQSPTSVVATLPLPAPGVIVPPSFTG